VPAAEKLALRVYGESGGGGSPCSTLRTRARDRELEDVAPGSYEVRSSWAIGSGSARTRAGTDGRRAGQQAAVELVVRTRSPRPTA
jgi:hypothetical protein